MAKPTAKSTVSQMKDYIRANRLNKAPIRLGMKRDELIAGLRKLGHWDAQHDGTAPKRKSPKKPAPVRAIADKPENSDITTLDMTELRRSVRHLHRRNQRNPFERSLTDPHRRPLRHPLGHPLIRRLTNS